MLCIGFADPFTVSTFIIIKLIQLVHHMRPVAIGMFIAVPVNRILDFVLICFLGNYFQVFQIRWIFQGFRQVG